MRGTRWVVVWLAIVLLALGAFAGCAAPTEEPPAEVAQAGEDSTEPDTQADVDAVIRAHAKLIVAYEHGDPEAFAAMLDDQPDLLIFHPLLQNRFDGIIEARESLELMFARLGKADWTDFHSSVSVQGDVGWLTSEVLLESDALKEPFRGRATELWIRRGEDWRLIHGHWSANPESGAR